MCIQSNSCLNPYSKKIHNSLYGERGDDGEEVIKLEDTMLEGEINLQFATIMPCLS